MYKNIKQSLSETYWIDNVYFVDKKKQLFRNFSTDSVDNREYN